ncbi:MAG: hypothetical protein V4772_08705 [Pseudomonadota bacterium]
MGLLNGLSQAVSGTGYAAGEMYGKMALEDQRAQVELEKQSRLAELQGNKQKEVAKYTEDLKNEPLNRFGKAAQAMAGSGVPLEAAPVKAFSGVKPDRSKFGMTGDINKARGLINAIADPTYRAEATAQLDQQIKDDEAAAQEGVKGKMRSRTSDEAFDAALAKLKIEDPVAYAAAKPLSADKTLAVPEGTTIIDQKTGRPIFSSSGVKEARESEREDRRDARQAELEAGRDRRQLQALAAAEARAILASTGKTPSGYKQTEGGELTFIPGGPADPSTKEKPLPASAAKALLENQQNVRRAEIALGLVQGSTVNGAKGDKSATGAKGWLPNQLLNRVDPEGVDTRAAIADLGSLVVHERSGAAVTASEFPRLAPFIPTEKDDAPTVQKKLKLFVDNYKSIIDDAAEFYKASGYKVPVDSFKPPKIIEPAGQKPAISLPSGWSVKKVE